MVELISSSPNHYDFLLEKAKEAIRHDFDNCGNWIYRQRIIEDAVEGEMPEDFISELESDQAVEIKYEKESAQIARREFQQQCGLTYTDNH